MVECQKRSSTIQSPRARAGAMTSWQSWARAIW